MPAKAIFKNINCCLYPLSPENHQIHLKDAICYWQFTLGSLIYNRVFSILLRCYIH